MFVDVVYIMLEFYSSYSFRAWVNTTIADAAHRIRNFFSDQFFLVRFSVILVDISFRFFPDCISIASRGKNILDFMRCSRFPIRTPIIL